MLIGELARQAGLTPGTIRFYEKRGLLNGAHRTRMENNYKDYGPAALERLRLISQAKSVGFTLAETKQWLLNWDARGPAERREVLLNKIAEIDGRMVEMETMKTHLTAKVGATLGGHHHGSGRP